MVLIDPALTNQAMMEGVPPDLFKQAMRSKLMRYCIPNIPIAETMEAFYDKTYTDRMAPLNFDKIHYFFIKDPNREDKKGNLYSPEEPIQFWTKKIISLLPGFFFPALMIGKKMVCESLSF